MHVPDEAGATRDQREAAHDRARHAAVAQHGGDGSGGVDGDVLARRLVDGRVQNPDGLLVPCGGPLLPGQNEADLLWIRNPFLRSKADHGKVVVHGHTPNSEPEVRVNRIAVDTGACYGGQLTALVLADDTYGFLHT